MSQVRFLDQVSVTAFKADSGAPATGNDAVIPRIILPGTTFTVSKNTNVEVSELIVAEGATLIIEEGGFNSRRTSTHFFTCCFISNIPPSNFWNIN